MRVLLCSHGSTGDIFPVIALGRALIAAGHSVRFAAVTVHGPAIEKAGLEFLPLPPEVSFIEFFAEAQPIIEQWSPLGVLKLIYKGMIPYLPEWMETLEKAAAEADVFAYTQLFPFFDQVAKRAGACPVMLMFSHITVPDSEHAPHPCPQSKYLPSALRKPTIAVSWKIVDRVITFTLNRVLGKSLTRLGWDKNRRFFLGGNPTLVTVSPALKRPGAQWPENFHASGYLRWQEPADESLLAEIDGFTAGAPVPVVTFGSMLNRDHVAFMDRFLKAWPTGKKILFQSGWAGYAGQDARPEVHTFGAVSHDALFARASVIVHHGGAGTTASALYAGKPQILVPHIADQPFWVSEVKRLGLGTSVSRRRWPEALPAAITELEQDHTCAVRAAAFADTLRRETPDTEAVKFFERLIP